MLQRTPSALSLLAAVSLTLIASSTLAQDRPRPAKTESARTTRVQPTRKTRPVASKRSPKQAHDRRDDALFGGDDESGAGQGESSQSSAAGSPDPFAQDPSLADGVEEESFDDLETEATPATQEAEERGSTRPPRAPRRAAPATRNPSRWLVTPVGSAPERPAVLAWSDGADIPDGYEKGTRTRNGLVIAGAVTLGVSWLAAGAFGVHLANQRDPGAWRRDNETPPEALLFIPVAGPWVALSAVDLNRGQAAALIADGVAQAGGLAMLAAGVFARETVLVKTETASVGVAPLIGPSGNGLTLQGSF